MPGVHALARAARPAAAVTLTVAAGLAPALMAAPASAHAALRGCPSLRVARDDRVPIRVQDVSCAEADRLVLAWRHNLGRDPNRCVPTNDGVKRCTLEHWRFSCPQTRNGQYFAVTARDERGRGRLAFHYKV